jgi:hypothetical protein
MASGRAALATERMSEQAVQLSSQASKHIFKRPPSLSTHTDTHKRAHTAAGAPATDVTVQLKVVLPALGAAEAAVAL